MKMLIPHKTDREKAQHKSNRAKIIATRTSSLDTIFIQLYELMDTLLRFAHTNTARM